MSRPRNAIGTYGTVNVSEIGPSKFRARTRYRFDDGKLRQVERFDVTGPKATAALKRALKDIETPRQAAITSSTELAVLAEKFLEWKAASKVAARTIETYRWAVEAVIAPTERGRVGIGTLTVREADTERLNRFLGVVAGERGNGVAKTTKSVLSGMMGMAVRAGAATVNSVREVDSISRANVGSTAVTLDAMPGILAAVRNDAKMAELDLADMVEFLAGTGARISEVLALQWPQVDDSTRTVSIVKNVVRIKGSGMVLQEHTKTDAGMRKLEVPEFVVTMLQRRRDREPNEHELVFPSVLGKIRDPNNTLRDWRENRGRVGAAETTFHSFRKYVATALDAAGLSARDIAEYLGHRRPSLTQDTYRSRKVGGSKAAAALSNTLS